ncbi:sulfatase [Anaerobaca lacustris]|uniref:Sulfatase n=1 Tax=Anaerobaca lacustris TaxID=3044600 RepID=A0AAW6TY67_9BACT|nr:sulfatase [Sedimentisphaerales bacterium M17dextr]
MQKAEQAEKRRFTRRGFLRSTAALTGLLAMSPGHVAEAYRNRISAKPTSKNTRPNIVFFFVDDLGWQDTSVPFWEEVTELNKRYRTPHMEKLANEGVKFTNAYAAAICSPTRISIMTGQNAARHRVTYWTRDLNQITGGNGPLLDAPQDWNYNALQPKGTDLNNSIEAEPLPALLSEAGYRTMHIGKAHLGTNYSPGECPTSIGFNDNVSGFGSGGPGCFLGRRNFGNEYAQHTYPWGVPDLEHYHGMDLFLTEAHTIEAFRLMDDAVKNGQPFFLHMSHYAVHTPLRLDQRFADNYPDLSGNELMYATMIEGMDKSLGDILRRLEALGIEDNTIVILYSDNGALTTILPRNYPLRGGKGTGYEGGIRVPLIIKWPGAANPGSTCSVNVTAEDFYPTILAMAGVDMPAAYKKDYVDGRDFTPLLNGEGSFDRDRPIFFHQPHYHVGKPYSTVIKNNWKLIYWHEDSSVDLYDLKNDIREQNNLAVQNPKKTTELKTLLGQHLSSVQAQMPTQKTNGQMVVPYPSGG